MLLRPRAVHKKFKAYLWVLKHKIDANVSNDEDSQRNKVASSILLDRLGTTLDF